MKSLLDFRPMDYVSVVLLLSTSMYTSVHAGDGLDAQQREQIKTIGTALLQAKRSYVPDPQIRQMRDNIEQVRQQLETLTAPIMPDKPLTVSTTTQPSSSVAAAQKQTITANWQQVRKTEIDQLRQTRIKLRDHHRVLRATSQFTPQGAATHSGDQVISPITPAALTRLETLDVEIEEAIALPEAERHTALRRLADELRLIRQAPLDVSDTPTRETPTMTSRTEHRRN